MEGSEAFWDKTAKRYAAKPVKDLVSYEETLRRTRAYLSQEYSVLELGCGTGTTALKLSGDVRHVTATDISENMLAIGREKAARQEIENVDFVRATPFDAQLPEAAFDAVLAFNLLHLIDDVPEATRAIRERLKPGGYFISKTSCVAGKPIIRGVVKIMQMIGKAPRITFLSTETLEKIIAKAGFEIVETGNYPPTQPVHFIVARKS